MLPTKVTHVKTVALTAASLYVTGWGLYYLAQETIRRSHLRARKRKYPLKAPILPPHAIVAGARIASRVGVLGQDQTPQFRQNKVSENVNGHASLTAQTDGESTPDLESCSSRQASWYGGASDTELERIQRRFSSLHILGRYANVVPEWREQGAWEWLIWKGFYSLFYKPRIWWDGGFANDFKSAQGKRRIEELLPVQKVDWKSLFAPCPDKPRAAVKKGSQSSFTWIGQSTCLIQLEGLTILTDPVFGEQPVKSVFSPRRMRPLPCDFDELMLNANVDVVLITHNHFDHLDVSILARFGSNTTFVVPIGLTALLIKYGIDKQQIIELDWWQQRHLPIEIRVASEKSDQITRQVRTLDVTAVPASHWSARSPLDTNTTLWNSYAVRVHLPAKPTTSSKALFFCGDTGYSPSLFTAIGRALGPFDLACVPIGSYEPRWHMAIQHMHVTESVQVTHDVGSKRGFAMHWGTWQMSDERWDDPHRELQQELTARGDAPDQLMTVPFGKTFEL